MISYIILKLSNEHKQMLQKRCDVLNDTMHYLLVHEFSWAELAMENITAKQRISSTLLVWFSWAITAIRKNLRHSFYGHVDIGSCTRGLRSQCQRGDVVPGNICPLQSWAPFEKRISKYLKLLLNFALGNICMLNVDSFLKQQFFPMLNSSTWKFLTLRWTVRPGPSNGPSWNGTLQGWTKEYPGLGGQIRWQASWCIV